MIVGGVLLIMNTLSYKAIDGAYPHTVLALIVVLAAVGLYRSFAHRREPVTAETPTTGAAAKTSGATTDWPGRSITASVRTLAYVALTVLYALAWNWIGTLLATLIFVAAVVLLLGERRIWLIVGVPIVLTALIYYLFQVVLYLPFPAGPLSP